MILTAAHCVSNLAVAEPPSSVKVGHSNQFSPEIQEVSIELVKSHEEFGRDSKFKYLINDVALLKLSEPLTFDEKVAPLCLPSKDTEIKEKLSLAGWGFAKLASRFVLPEILQYLDNLEYVPSDVCNEEYRKQKKPDFKLKDQHVCASGEKGLTDGCTGDSGGSLFQAINDGEEDMRYETIGIVSTGAKSCISQVPAVYAKVSKFVSWIEDFVYENRP